MCFRQKKLVDGNYNEKRGEVRVFSHISQCIYQKKFADSNCKLKKGGSTKSFPIFLNAFTKKSFPIQTVNWKRGKHQKFSHISQCIYQKKSAGGNC